MCSITEIRRKFERQENRTNLRRFESETIFVPYVEALSQIEERLTNHIKKALSLRFIFLKLSGKEGVQETHSHSVDPRR